MKGNASACFCGLNVVSKFLRTKLNSSSSFYGWMGVWHRMATLSSTGKEMSPQTERGIMNYFKQKEIQFQHGHTTIIAKCPFCLTSSKVTRNSVGSQESFSLFVNKMTGTHVCNSCGTSGTWNQLKVQ